MHALSINFTMSLPCSRLHLSKVLLLLLMSSSSFSDSSLLTHCSPPSLVLCTAPNLAHSPHFTQAMHSGSYWCPTLGTPCDLWPGAAWLFPAAQPSDLSPLPIHLDDCAHFYLNSACCVSPLVATNHVLPWTVSTRQRSCLISLGGKLPESSNPVYMTIASHTVPANISRTVHSAQMFSQILSVEYKIASACHVWNACSQVARLFWDVLETQKVAPIWKI